MLYFYPNKPILIHPDSSVIHEKSVDSDWWAEIKKNGTRLCLWKSKEDSVKHNSYNDFIFWNRHKEVLKYSPSNELLDQLRSLNIPNGTHIDAELLHHKTTNIKHFIYVYDIYRLNGEMIEETLDIRRKMIEDLIKDSSQIQVAKIYTKDFNKVFDEVIKTHENEGLVMKSKKGKIIWSFKKCQEVWWQLKVRKPSGSYSF